MSDNFVAYCSITTWVGTSALGAQHYYGRIVFSDVSENLSYILSESDAIEHNKKARDNGRSHFEYVSPGESSESFYTKDDVRKEAIKCFLAGEMPDHWDGKKLSLKGALFLIEGSPMVAQPQLILACIPGLEVETKALNDLFLAGKGWWWDTGFNKALDSLSNRWDALMKETHATHS